MNRILPILIAVLVAAPLAAQNRFRADLDGAQQVPPVITDTGGWATVDLNADNTLTYLVRTWGLTGTDAHIHVGAVGVSGGILVPLTGGPTTWSGTSAVLTAAEIAILRASGLYVNVHTAANPGGEVRGQIVPRPVNFAALLTGDQMVPPVVTGASGTGTFAVNPDNTISYSVITSGLVGTAAHIHIGDAGTSGGILFPLAGGPTVWSGTTPALTAATFETMQANGLHVIVHTAANPGGEIRGQIIPEGIPYGWGCPGATGLTTILSSSGAPMSGETVTLSVTGGQPSGTGILAVAFSPEADLLFGCQLLVDLNARRVPLALDAAGDATLPALLPTLTSSLDVYLQFWGQDSTGAWYNSNGLLLPIEVF